MRVIGYNLFSCMALTGKPGEWKPLLAIWESTLLWISELADLESAFSADQIVQAWKDQLVRWPE